MVLATAGARRISQVFLILVAAFATASDSNAGECSAKFLGDEMPCHLQVISWVEVTFDGTAEKLLDKTTLEKLIRLRLRNDLSVIDHEYIDIQSFGKKEGYENIDKPQWKRRGGVVCHIWTVGEDYPIAHLTECKLFGWGNYSTSVYRIIESRFLGYAYKSEIKNEVDAAIRGAIASISSEFFETRDFLRGLSK